MHVCADMLFAHVLTDLASADPTPYNLFASNALLESLLKKQLPSGADGCTEEQEEVAIAKFLEANERCSRWSLQLRDSRDEEITLLFREEVNGFFNVNKKTSWGMNPLDLSPLRAFTWGRSGPGAAVGTRHLTFYSKMFGGPMAAYDSDLYHWYRAAIAEDERWVRAEEARLQSFGLPHVVGGSKLSVVPKNVKTGRTICVESSLAGFAQLGQGLILEKRLDEYFGIHIKGGKHSVQHSKNQQLARIGSVNGSYATIDLSSASDSISLGLVKEFVPEASLWGLNRTRAPKALIRGQLHDLHMISSMGNGYTFPLMTALFACAVVASYRFVGLEVERPYGRSLGNFAVFGDDIIVKSEAFRILMRLLDLLGFVPNESKTFSDGPFRESCGADWLSGRPVRGVYIRRLSSLEERFSAFNALSRWVEQTGIKLPGSLAYLVRSIPRNVRFWVPPWENPDAGLHAPTAFHRPRMVRFREPDTGKVVKVYGWDYEVRRPVARQVALSVGCKTPFWNDDGVMLAVLGGYVRDKDGDLVLGLPKDKTFNAKYRTERKVTLNWEVQSPHELVRQTER